MSYLATRLRIASAAVSKYTRSDMSGLHDHGSFSNSFDVSGYKNGVSVPQYRDKIARHVDASSAYSAVYCENSSQANIVTTTGVIGNPPYRVDASYLGRHNVDPVPFLQNSGDTGLRDLALQRIKRKVADRSKQVNLMVPLVEIAELRGTLKSVAYASIDILMALIDIKRSKGKSAYKYASHAWLTWSFGIKPTILEAQEICNSISEFILRKNAEAVRDRAGAKSEWVTSHRLGTGGPYGTTGTNVVTCRHSLTYNFVAGYLPALSAGNNYDVVDHLGLSFGSMVPAAWELTPFSWVFDYFSTMGDFIDDTFTASPVSKTIYCTESRKYVMEMTVNPEWKLTNGLYLTVLANKPQKLKYTAFTRTPLTALPARSLRIRTPQEITGVNGSIETIADVEKAIKRTLNLAAVLVGGDAYSSKRLK